MTRLKQWGSRIFRWGTDVWQRWAHFRQGRPIPNGVRFIGGLLLMVLIGTGLLLLPGVAPQGRLSFNQALFTAVSALSVTGLSIITPAQDLTQFGQIILMILIQLGGVGFMFIAVIVLQALGRQVNLSNRLALRESLGLSERVPLWPTIKAFVQLMLAIEGVGAFLLWLHWRTLLPPAEASFYALFHAVSSFCNAGFDLFSGHADFPNGLPRDALTLVIMGGLIVLGGLGSPVLRELTTHRRGRRWSLHTQLTVIVTVILIVSGALIIGLAESRPGGTLEYTPLGQRLTLSTFQSISARTAGFAALPRFSELTPASQWSLVILMFIGTAPASMGGGITTGTLAVLVIAVWSYSRGYDDVRIRERVLPIAIVRRAASILLISLMAVAGATWLILMTNNLPFNDTLFETVSAFATTGLSLDSTSQLNGVGQIIIMALMLWGRLGALTLTLALAQQRPRARVDYPEEHILLG